jgi:protein-tyrosine kinase
MSLVEKALRKLQTTRGTPETPQRGAAPASESRRADVSIPIAEPVPVVEEASFDPHRHTSRIVRIDRERLEGLKVLPPKSQERQMATQFRGIKRPLIRFAQESVATNDVLKRTFMVASALPGDGKTFTTMNLALSLAMESDLRVLLVDADSPKRHLTQTLDLDRERGLLDVLRDDGPKVEEVILPTDVPRLDVLPVGTRSETATELVASMKMRETVHRLATLYRRGIVLFDSPPILLTNESRSLATMLGQIVLVVRAGVTPQRAVKDAVAALGEGLRISLVFNGAELEGAAAYYYGHRYGYGYGEDAQRPPSDGEA